MICIFVHGRLDFLDLNPFVGSFLWWVLSCLQLPHPCCQAIPLTGFLVRTRRKAIRYYNFLCRGRINTFPSLFTGSMLFVHGYRLSLRQRYPHGRNTRLSVFFQVGQVRGGRPGGRAFEICMVSSSRRIRAILLLLCQVSTGRPTSSVIVRSSRSPRVQTGGWRCGIVPPKGQVVIPFLTAVFLVVPLEISPKNWVYLSLPFLLSGHH